MVFVRQQNVPHRDYSITLSGASEQVLPADNWKHFFFIQNIGNAPIGVNTTGGVAAIGSPGTITLYPGGDIQEDTTMPYGPINVIGTMGQPITVLTG